ncbi:MAG: preprotein translocase subunit SecE [Cellvibrionales bacterium]|nr:preprotein translocase subunit SecE [Cellvibrionales bacterium]
MSKKAQKAEAPESRFDGLKWAAVGAILIAVAVGNSYYSDESLLYRVLGGLLMGALACAIAAQTRQGAIFWNLAKGSRAEVRRVVWPTRSERNRATLLVVVFVFFTAIVLWALDALFGWLGSMLLGG